MVPKKEDARRMFEAAAKGKHFEELFIGPHSHAFSSHLGKSDIDLIDRSLFEDGAASTFDEYEDMVDTIKACISENFDEFYEEYAKAYTEKESGNGDGKFELTMFSGNEDPYHGFNSRKDQIGEMETKFITVRGQIDFRDHNLSNLHFYIETAYPELYPSDRDIELAHKNGYPEAEKPKQINQSKDRRPEIKKTKFYREQNSLLKTYLELKNNPKNALQISYNEQKIAEPEKRSDTLFIKLWNPRSLKTADIEIKINDAKRTEPAIGGPFRGGTSAGALITSSHGTTRLNLRTKDGLETLERSFPDGARQVRDIWKALQQKEASKGRPAEGLFYDSGFVRGVDLSQCSIDEVQSISLKGIGKQSAKSICDCISRIENSADLDNPVVIDDAFYERAEQIAGIGQRENVTQEREEVKDRTRSRGQER